MDFLFDILRNIMFTIDSIVYGLISSIYELLMYLANLDLFQMSQVTSTTNASDNIILSFASRIYVLLGVFMLFKLSFSILQYIVDPNAFSDKSKGFGKLMTNVLVSLGLIVLVPFIFSLAFEAQGIVLNENVIGKIIMGGSTGETNNINAKNRMLAEDMQFLVFGTFFSVDGKAIEACGTTPVLGTKAMAANTPCINRLNEKLSNEKADINKFFRITDVSDNGDYGRDFGEFGKALNIKENDEYVFHYQYIISTIVGAVVVWMLLGFCIDIAIRIIKLAFLEIIAPIPIISYMDPKESASNGMLSRWGKECFSTYASLFIRLATIYLVFFMISVVSDRMLMVKDGVSNLYLNNEAPEGLMAVMVVVFVIIGLLMFAKQVPSLIESIFGIKASGSFNSIGGIFKNAAVAGTAGLIGGTIGGGIGSMASNIINARKNELGLGQTLKSAVGGLGSGAIRGGAAGLKNKNAIKGAAGGIAGSNAARYRRSIYNKAGYAFPERMLDRVNKFAGVKNKDAGIGRMDRDIKALNRQMENVSQAEHAVRDAYAKHTAHNAVGYNMLYERDAKGNLVNFKYDENGNFRLDQDKVSDITQRLSAAGLEPMIELKNERILKADRKSDYDSLKANLDSQINEINSASHYKDEDRAKYIEQLNQDFNDKTKDMFEERQFYGVIDDDALGMQRSIDDYDNRYEELRQEKSRLEDVTKLSSDKK